jgi:hypothetical protein
MAKSNQLQKSNPYLVVQDNEFINFRHTLTVQEARVFLSVVSQVEKDDIDFKPYKIDVEQFVEAVGLKRKDMYSELKKVSDQLTSKKFRKEKEDGSFLITNYISSAEYRSGEGFVELTFDPKLKPYLLGLKSHFTQYDIRNILSLRSIFSILLFQQLKQFEKIGQRTYNLIDLKYKLNVDDKFKQYNDFKRFVLEVAEKEIKENCDIYFKFVEVKKGRKVVSIEFYIYSQTPPREKTKLIEKPKPKPQDEPCHISNLITDVPFVEVPPPPKQEQPQTITTPPPTFSSVPSMATIQALGEKLKLTIEQVNEITAHYNHDSVRVWEVLQATTKQEGVKSAMGYIMGSHGLGAGLWNEQQKKIKQAQEKELKRLIEKLQDDYSRFKDKQFEELYNKATEAEKIACFDVIKNEAKNKYKDLSGNIRNLKINDKTGELNHHGILNAGEILAELKKIGIIYRQNRFTNYVFEKYNIQIRFNDDKIIY